jgi:hypothetical protein
MLESSSMGMLFAYITVDVLVLAGLIAAGMMLALYLGKSDTLALLLSVYPALALATVFPYVDVVQASIALPGQGAKAVVFLVLLVASYFVLRKFLTGFFPSGAKRYIHAVILGALLSGVLLSTIFVSFELTQMAGFSPLLLTLFGQSSYYFWWLVAPLPALLLSEKL